MAPNTAVLKPYLGSDSLRQNVQGEIKHMKHKQILPTRPRGEKMWKGIVTTPYDKKIVISGRSHDGQK